ICSTTIAAPPLAVLSKILDTTSWPSWNTYCKSAAITHTPPAKDVNLNAPELQSLVGKEGHLYTGVKATFSAYMTADVTSPSKPKEVVTVLERFERDGRTGYRVAWQFESMPRLMLHAERVQEVVEVTGDDGAVRTEYYSWETFGGVLAPVLKWTQAGALYNGFARWMDGLKGVTEANARES
ncbi:hypothetical protein ACHAQH_009976, partial [Verticillium albo-atrum]